MGEASAAGWELKTSKPQSAAMKRPRRKPWRSAALERQLSGILCTPSLSPENVLVDLSQLNKRASRRGYSAIHEQRLPCNVTARLRREKNDCGVQILRLPRRFRNAIAKIFDPFFVLVEDLVLFGAKPSRRETIHGDAVLAPVVRKTHCQLPNASAAGAIGAEASVACDAGDRADVDDASVAASNHAARDGLCDKKTAAKIGIENQIPIFPSYIERWFADIATGIVYENIETAKGGVSFRGHFLDALLSADVELDGNGAAAERFDFRLKVRQATDVAAREYKIRPGFREGASHVAGPRLVPVTSAARPLRSEQTAAHEALRVRMTFIKLGSRA
jgi:hypothetical protein